MPGPHPDDDLLADLAADVLPVEQARIVEAHVLQCDRCAQLLSDAERVRRLLLADDPGPVPPAVWSRIEAVLLAETGAEAEGSTAHRRAAQPERRPSVAPPFLAETGAWDGPDPLDDPDRWNSARPSAAQTPPTARNVVPGPGGLRGLTTTRRDTRRDRRGPRLSLVIAAAAAVVAFAVVGTARLLGGGNPGSGSTALSSGTAQNSRAAAAAVLVSSGQNYTARDLARQVRPLLATGTAKGTAGSAEASRAGAASAPRAPASPSGTTTAGSDQAPSASGARRAAAVAPDPRATDVRNPQRLAACLAALNASSEPVVAVDLARFQDREAAVLVLSASAGGYEVFVVERTCAPGDEGTLDFARLPG